MTARTRCTSGVVIPANVADRIEAEAAKLPEDVRAAFVVGAEYGFRGKMPILTSHSAEVDAWRDGLRLGHWLRAERQFRFVGDEIRADLARGIDAAMREFERRVAS